MKKAINLTRAWKYIPGAGYGVRQSKIVGNLEIKISAAFDFKCFRENINKVFEACGLRLSSIKKNDGGVISELINGYFSLHVGIRAPIFEAYSIQQQFTVEDSTVEDFHIAVPCLNQVLACNAFDLVISVANMLLAGYSLNNKSILIIKSKFERLRQQLQEASPEGINTFHILRAADRLSIDVAQFSGNIYRFGKGVSSRHFKSTLTDMTSPLGIHIAKEKWQTNQCLRAMGIPVPKHRRVSTLEAARQAATELGYPVVIKPENQEQGRGVNANLRDAAALDPAFAVAKKFSQHILVEQHVFGDEFRFTVLHDRVVKIVQRRPGGVVGNGTETITSLIDIASQSKESKKRLIDLTYRPLCLDDEALGMLVDQDLTPDSIPALGQFVPMRRRGNILSGGTQLEVDPASVHLDNLELAVRATRCLRLDLSGIDIILTDAKRSWMKAGGAIIEVNAMPQIGIDFSPTIYQEILIETVPNVGKIPTHLFLQMNSDSVLSENYLVQLAADLAYESISCNNGIWINGRQVSLSFSNSFDAAQALLSDNSVSSVSMVMTPEDVLRFGLPTTEINGVSKLFLDQSSKDSERILHECLRLIQPHIVNPIFHE